MDGDERSNQSASINGMQDFPFAEILNNLEDELIVIVNDYRIKYVNSALLEKLSEKLDRIVGKPCYAVIHKTDHPCSEPLWNCPLNKVLATGKKYTVVHPASYAEHETYIKLNFCPLKDTVNNIVAVLETRRDVTSERELENQLLIRRHQLSALHHISSAIAGLQDIDTILRTALDNVLTLIDCDIGGILLLDENSGTLRYRVHHGLSPKYVQEMSMKIGEGIAGYVAQTGKPEILEDISRDPRTSRSDLVSAEGLKGFVSVPLKAKNRVIGVMNFASHTAKRFGADDISLLCSIGEYLGTAIEQATLYNRLARASERYHALLQHALTAQEQERKRIARELHDETSQAITSLTLNLHALAGVAEMKGIGDAEFLNQLKMLHSYAVHAGNEIVKLMKELRPTLLDELGMPAAIQRYAKDALQPRGINLSCEFIGTEERLPSEIEITLFRVAQGAIGNILEHSEAKNASIKLVCNSTECVMEIIDDGKGFDVSKLTRVDPSGRGAGVFTMKERVSLVGGSCYIDSSPGKGTRVHVKVPVSRGQQDAEDQSIDS
ncbi:MAG: GAF domain-containing protein [Dehalococcoidales bacterium]|jgi:signal transduction histidine kinase|nr:GAF domain-containing protein [Dehalococcoidales bacterium]